MIFTLKADQAMTKPFIKNIYEALYMFNIPKKTILTYCNY
jgi:hypothetical protein